MDNEKELIETELNEEKVPEEEALEAAPIEEKEPEPITYSSKYLENIEEARANFLKVYRKQNTIKWIISFIAIAAVIFGCVIAPNILPGNNGLIVMVSVLGASLAATILYTVFARKSIHKKMKAYFDLFYENINAFVFDEDVKDVTMPFPGRIESQVFLDNNLYKDVLDVGSRGLTEFVYKDIPVALVDAAAQVRKDKRLVPAYVGKYLYAGANYKYDEGIYIYYKGDKRALPPTNLSGLKVVQEDKKMVIYTENKDWKKALNTNAKKVLSSITMNGELVDLAISIQKGRVFVCMGYDDPLMVLPLQNQFDPRPTEGYKKDVKKVLKLIEELNK